MKINNKTDFTKTLNLPKQVINIKENQIKKEDYLLNKIQDYKRYQFTVNKNMRNGGKKYKIIEMPTDIDNSLSSTIIFNKILKDFVVKYSLTQGNYMSHDLIFTNSANMEQIETLPSNKTNLQELIKARSSKRKELANMFKGQIIEINNLGTTINYDKNTLTTIKEDFETQMLSKFFAMYNEGRLSKKIKTVRWCTGCGSLKRKKEVEYILKEVDNFYVKYKVKDDKGLFSKFNNLESTYFLAMTIKPWSMATSENVAIAKDLEYCLVEVVEGGKNVHFVIASDFVDNIMQKELYVKYDIKLRFKAEEIKGVSLVNPLDYKKNIKIIVTDSNNIVFKKEETTGIRIVSSGHTYIDYLILKENNNNEIKPIINEVRKYYKSVARISRYGI